MKHPAEPEECSVLWIMDELLMKKQMLEHEISSDAGAQGAIRKRSEEIIYLSSDFIRSDH